MKNRDMTSGAITRQLIIYSIPILLGNILQQLYNAFDAIVVGNFVSNHALAAVGSAGPLINMIVSFFMGLSMGSTVLISQYFGAKDEEGVGKTVHTAVSISAIIGIVLAAVGAFGAPYLLRWMATPADVMAEATEYLQIYFMGMAGLTVYNMGAAILRAVGDSKRPLYFLIVSTVINIVGDLLFVITFKMGIAGVAWSTVIAQYVSMILVIIVLVREKGAHRLYFKRLRIHGFVMKRVLRIGLPGGIQSAIISFSNAFVQSYINRMGSGMMAGYSAASKLDGFIMLPAQSLSMAGTTFVGQNLGAKQVQRAREGAKKTLVIGVAVTLVMSALILLFSKSALRIFSPDESVLEIGIRFIRVFAPFYVFLCINQSIQGVLRGAGDVNISTITSITCFVGIRQLYLFVATKISYTPEVVAFGFPVTWALAALTMFLYYRKTNWTRFETESITK